MAWLKNSWWNWLAKEEKRHPKANTRPPITAVSRVDLRLHTPTVKGEKISPKDSERPPRAPERHKKSFFFKSFFHPDQIRSTSDFRPLWCISMYFMLLPPPPPPQFQNWIQFKTMKDHPARSSLKVVLFFASSFSSQNFWRKSNHLSGTIMFSESWKCISPFKFWMVWIESENTSEMENILHGVWYQNDFQ